MADIFQIKDFTVTGTEASPQTVFYKDLTGVTNDPPGVIDPEPAVVVTGISQDVEVTIFDIQNNKFKIKRSELGPAVTVKCNIMICKGLIRTEWLSELSPSDYRLTPTVSSSDPDQQVYSYTIWKKFLFITPVPDEVWSLRFWYRYRQEIVSFNQEIDLDQNWADHLEDKVLTKILLMNSKNPDGSISKADLTLAGVHSQDYEKKLKQTQKDVLRLQTGGNLIAKACRF